MAQKPIDLLLTTPQEIATARPGHDTPRPDRAITASQRSLARKTLADRRTEEVARALSHANRKIPLFRQS